MEDQSIKNEYIGDEAILKRNLLNISHPINASGVVDSWEDLEKIWHHTFFSELREAPEEVDGVIIITSPLMPEL